MTVFWESLALFTLQRTCDEEIGWMENLVKLFNNYQEFIDSGYEDSLHLFGEWLKQRYSQSSDYLSKESTVNAVGPTIVATYMLGRMNAYFEQWMRLAMKDEPIAGQMDWSILKKVEEFGNPSKKEVILEASGERTSCVEAIKRLIRGGILSENLDESDGRIRRIALTEQGTALVRKLNTKMYNLGLLLLGTLNETEQKSIIPPLKKLIGFHENLSKTKDKEDVKKLYKI